MLSTDGMSRHRLTPYKSTIIHNNCQNYNSGSSSTLILDLQSFINIKQQQRNQRNRATLRASRNIYIFTHKKPQKVVQLFSGDARDGLPKCRLAPTVKHTGQESGGQLRNVF